MKKGNKAKLNELVARYGINKTQADDLKKQVEADNKAIKAIMEEEDLTDYEHNGWIAKYSIQHRENMDEENLLVYLESKCPDICDERSIIKTRKYVDFDALESAIYKGVIKTNIVAGMDKFKQVQEVPVLKIVKAKKEK